MDQYLLDTCGFLWLIKDDTKKFSSIVKDIFLNQKNIIYVSIISQIELSIKANKHSDFLSRPVIDYFTIVLEEYCLNFLHLTQKDIDIFSKLPNIHNDPFDRLLISQAINNNMSILTPDTKILKYAVKTIW